MPSPSTQLVTLRPDLGGSFEALDLVANRDGFVGLQVFPVVESQLQGGTFGKIPLAELLKNADVKRRNKSGYNRSDWTFTDEPFATSEYGFEEPVDHRDAKMYANYFDAEMIAAGLARNTVLLEAEKRYVSSIFDTAVWTGASLTTAVGTAWSAANSTPIDDVEGACLKVFANCGMWPNAIVMSRYVFRKLRLNSQIIDRITSSGAGTPAKASDITKEMLAAVFDLSKIIVAGGAKNTANEGQAATPDHIWGKTQAMVCRVAETDSIKEPCIGRTIHWAADGSQVGGTMESYYDVHVRGDVVRCRHDVQEKVIYKEAGHLLTSVAA